MHPKTKKSSEAGIKSCRATGSTAWMLCYILGHAWSLLSISYQASQHLSHTLLHIFNPPSNLRLVELQEEKLKEGLPLFMFGASIPLEVDYSWSQLVTGSNQTWNPWRPCQDLSGHVGHSMHTVDESCRGQWSSEQTLCSLQGKRPLTGSFQTKLILHGHWEQDAHKPLFVSTRPAAQAVFSGEQQTQHLQLSTLEWSVGRRHHPPAQEGTWRLLPKESASSQAYQLQEVVC